jgi:hypothetical protein
MRRATLKHDYASGKEACRRHAFAHRRDVTMRTGLGPAANWRRLALARNNGLSGSFCDKYARLLEIVWIAKGSRHFRARHRQSRCATGGRHFSYGVSQVNLIRVPATPSLERTKLLVT